MNRAIVIFAAAALAAAAAAALSHEHGEQWTLADPYPAASLPGEGDAFFARAVADATQGRISIVTMPDARLGYKPVEQMKAVAEGHTPMANTFGGALATMEPVFARASYPLVGRNAAIVRKHYDDTLEEFEAAFLRHNQKLLWSTPLPPSGTTGPVGMAFTTVNLDRWKALDGATRAAIEQAAAQTQARQWAALDEWADRR